MAKFAESNVDDQVRVQLNRHENVARADRRAFQLILHVPFVENVRVRSLLLKLGVCERDFALDSLIDREWLTRVRSCGVNQDVVKSLHNGCGYTSTRHHLPTFLIWRI